MITNFVFFQLCAFDQKRNFANFQLSKIGKIILTGLLLLMIDSAFIKSVHAQNSQNKDNKVCQITAIRDGELVVVGKPIASLISSNAAGGSPTEVSVTCQQPVKLTVSPPIQATGTEFTPISSLVNIVDLSSGKSTNSQNGTPLEIAAGNTTLKIDMSIDKGSVLGAGNYKYNIQLNFVP